MTYPKFKSKFLDITLVKPRLYMDVYYCSIHLPWYTQGNQLYLATGKILGYSYAFETDILNSIILGYNETNGLGYTFYTSYGEFPSYKYPSTRYKEIYLIRIYQEKWIQTHLPWWHRDIWRHLDMALYDLTNTSI